MAKVSGFATTGSMGLNSTKGLLDNTFNQESWGASLRAYQTQKVHTPWDCPPSPGRRSVQRPEPVHHVTAYEKARHEHANRQDTILQRYRDSQKEGTRNAVERTNTVRRLNNARDVQLSRESKYDVLNHSSKKAGLAGDTHWEAQQRENKSIKSGVKYNILSNHLLDDHNQSRHIDTKTLDLLPYEQQPVRATTPRLGGKRSNIFTAANRPRDTDVISNKFHRGHEQQAAREQQRALDTAAAKFWKKEDFNALTGKYYDREKEQRAQHLEAEARLQHGMDAVAQLPPAIRYGPGMAFDLASGAVKDPELDSYLRGQEEHTRLTAYRSYEGRRLEQHYKSMRQEDFDQKDGRELLRIKPQRFEQSLKVGYDIVTGQDFDGRKGKVVFPHRLPEQPSFWKMFGNEGPPQSTALRRSMTAPDAARQMPAQAERSPQPPVAQEPRPASGGAAAQGERAGSGGSGSRSAALSARSGGSGGARSGGSGGARSGGARSAASSGGGRSPSAVRYMRASHVSPKLAQPPAKAAARPSVSPRPAPAAVAARPAVAALPAVAARPAARASPSPAVPRLALAKPQERGHGPSAASRGARSGTPLSMASGGAVRTGAFANMGL